MRYLLLCVLCLLPLAAYAQNGIIERTLEDQLSTEGRTVDIVGLTGSLTARASVEEITVADRNGVWLTITNAVLDWDRAALFSGRLKVERLSAETLTVSRPPIATDAAPDAEPSGFSVPKLPVVIDIADLSIERVTLGAPVVGELAVLEFSASLLIEDGALDTDFKAQRLNGIGGAITLDLSFEPDSEVFTIDLDASEPAGGLIAQSLNIPGTPSVSLIAKGSGPLDRFRADIALATDGTDRLAGDVALQAIEEGRAFDVDIIGDLRPLVDAQTADILGARTALIAKGIANDDGTFVLEEFDLSTGELSLIGDAIIGQDGWPRQITADGTFSGPLPGSPITVGETGLSVAYDADISPIWNFDARIADFEHPNASAGELSVIGSGFIIPDGDSPFSGKVDVSALDFDIDDAAVLQAVGPTPQFTTELEVSRTGRTVFDDLAAVIATGSLRGSVILTPDDGQILVDAALDLDAPSITPLSGLANRPLAGTASLNIAAQASLPAGTAALEVSGTTNNLSAGIGSAEALITPQTEIDFTATRDDDGILIRSATIENRQIRATASGRIGPPSGVLQLRAALTDLAVLAPQVPGPVTANATLIGLDRIRADIQSATGLTVQANGRLNGPNGLAIAVDGTSPLAFVQALAPTLSITGQSSFNLAINGPPALSSVTGAIQIRNARVSDPNQGIGLENVTANVALQSGTAQISLQGQSDGGRVNLQGPVTLSAPFPMDLAVDLSNFGYRYADISETTVSGQITVSGDAINRLAIGGTLGMRDTNLRVPDTSLASAPPIPEINHINPSDAVRRTLQRAGLVADGQSAGSRLRIPLDLTVVAQSPIFVRGSGLDAVFDGALQIKGRAVDPQPIGQFTLTRGRLEILGQRLDLTQGTITLSGGLIPDLRVVASTQSEDVLAQITLEGPADNLDITLSSVPDLPEDEILARLIFGRSAEQLSTLQIAKIVNALSSLAGNTDVFEALRDGLGVDDFDLRTDDDGQAQLAIGNRISEEVYSEVEITDGGNVGITLNFDLTDSTRIQGTVDNEGSSGIGIFWQKDY